MFEKNLLVDGLLTIGVVVTVEGPGVVVPDGPVEIGVVAVVPKGK